VNISAKKKAKVVIIGLIAFGVFLLVAHHQTTNNQNMGTRNILRVFTEEQIEMIETNAETLTQNLRDTGLNLGTNSAAQQLESLGIGITENVMVVRKNEHGGGRIKIVDDSGTVYFVSIDNGFIGAIWKNNEQGQPIWMIY